MLKRYSKGLFCVAAGATLLLCACNDEITEVTEIREVGMQIVAAGDSLPKCTAENEGAMVYSVDSAAAYLCDSKAWTSLKGEKGDKGEPGAQGGKGDKGDKGDQGENGNPGNPGGNGKDGTSCTTEILPDSSGYKIICGKDSVGVVLNGKDGISGLDAECPVKEKEEDYNPTAMCGDVPYDPNKEECDGMCGTTPYISSRYICDERDYQIYKYVVICSQTWLAENMRYRSKYYTFYGAHEACPSGWHLPDMAEFRILINYAGGEAVAGKRLKATFGWEDEEGNPANGIDTYSFSAIPSGYSYKGDTRELHRSAYFWTRTIIERSEDYNTGYALSLRASSDGVSFRSFSNPSNMPVGYNVRCIRD